MTASSPDNATTTSCKNKVNTDANTADAASSGRREGAFICQGDQCFPVRKIRQEEEKSKQAFDIDAECQQWQEFSPGAKKLFGQGRVWVYCGPPCAAKIMCEPFHALMESVKHSFITSGPARVAQQPAATITEAPAKFEGPCQVQAATLLAAALAPWSYPRIKFLTDSQVAVCEKALSIYGRAPFLGLIDMPNSSAFVLELSQPAPCVKAERLVDIFKAVDNIQVRDFALNAIVGRWPKAHLGEMPPPEDVDPLTSGTLKTTLKAVQATLPRLVRGEVRTIHEAKRLELLRDQASSTQEQSLRYHDESSKDIHVKDRIRAGATGTGPLLSLLTLWAPRCPCCPPLIRMLDALTEMITSVEFKERFPACPLFSMDATLRNVTLDVDKNDLDDSEWPAAHEVLEPLASPSLGAQLRPTGEQLPAGLELGGSPPSAFPSILDTPENNSALGHPERALPTIMAYRDGRRVAKFSGIRTPKNLVLFVARAFGLLSSAAVSSTDSGSACSDQSWLMYLQHELERHEDEEDFDTLRKRSRTSDRAL